MKLLGSIEMSQCITGKGRVMAAEHPALGRGVCMPSIDFNVPVGAAAVPRGTKAEYTRASVQVRGGLNDHYHVRFPFTD